MLPFGRSPFDDPSGLCNHLYPTIDAVFDIGSPVKRIRNIYFVGFSPPGWTFSLGTPPASPVLTYSIVNQDDIAQIRPNNNIGGIDISGGSDGTETTGGTILLAGNSSFDTGAVEILSGAVTGSAIRNYLIDPSSEFFILDVNDNNIFEVSLTEVVSWIPLNMHTNLIHNVVDPVSPQDAATKNYVDTHPSDIRIKTDVEVINTTQALEKVILAEPIRFKFISQYDTTNRVKAGFVAQQIEHLFPEAVKSGDYNPEKKPDEPGFELWSVQTDCIVPYLVAAIQALEARIRVLEER